MTPFDTLLREHKKLSKDFDKLMNGYSLLVDAHKTLLDDLPIYKKEYLLTAQYPYELGVEVVEDLKGG